MVSLNKGGRVTLSKGDKPLTKLLIGLGWDVNRYDGEKDFDLDASVFLVKGTGKVGNESDFIFYNNLEHPTKAIIHMGDNITGSGDGDDELIKVDLSKVPEGYEKIVITVTIFEAEERMQNFGMVSNAYIHMTDEETNEEVLRYDLGEEASMETAVVIGEIYKYNEEWKFKAVGSGYNGGLAVLCNTYGISVK